MADESFILDNKAADQLRSQLLQATDKWVDLHSRMTAMRLPTGSLGKHLQESMMASHGDFNEKQGTIRAAFGTNVKDLWDKMMNEYAEATREASRTLDGVNQPDVMG